MYQPIVSMFGNCLWDLMSYSLSTQVFEVTAGPLEAFGHVVWQLLQDVQERLVFRAHLYLQSDILNYKPAPGDLAYPEKLEMMEVFLIE